MSSSCRFDELSGVGLVQEKIEWFSVVVEASLYELDASRGSVSYGSLGRLGVQNSQPCVPRHEAEFSELEHPLAAISNPNVGQRKFK
jgi:hypothetical protein